MGWSGSHENSGFTIIELIVVMVIIGILSITVLPKLGTMGAMDAAGFADQTASILRYGQRIAVAQRRWVAVDVGVNPPTICSQTDMPAVPGCSSGCAGGAGTQSIPLPGGAARTPQPTTTFNAGSPTLICFDAVGRPIASGASAAMASKAEIKIKDGADIFRTISIEAETGYVN